MEPLRPGQFPDQGEHPPDQRGHVGEPLQEPSHGMLRGVLPVALLLALGLRGGGSGELVAEGGQHQDHVLLGLAGPQPGGRIHHRHRAVPGRDAFLRGGGGQSFQFGEIGEHSQRPGILQPGRGGGGGEQQFPEFLPDPLAGKFRQFLLPADRQGFRGDGEFEAGSELEGPQHAERILAEGWADMAQ